MASKRTKAILHPIRAQILSLLSERPLTPLEMAPLLEEAPLGSLYRHLNVLLDAGLIVVVRERRVHGTVERQFAVVESQTNLADGDREELTRAELCGLVRALTQVVQTGFDRYASKAEFPPKEGDVALVVKTLYLSDEEVNELRQTMLTTFSKVGRKPSDGKRRLVGYFTVPDLE